jgi:hypothetical protein
MTVEQLIEMLKDADPACDVKSNDGTEVNMVYIDKDYVLLSED